MLVVAVVFGGGSSCLDALGEDDPPPCTANCAIEAECGFRTLEVCAATSCDPLGAPVDVAADACLAAAADCLEAAACACDSGCARIDECAESEPNPDCVTTCDTLVEQQSTATYLENRCRIEKACSDLATCSAVSG